MIKIEEFRDKFWNLVGQADNIALTTHHGPDGDAISSVLALKQIIAQKQPQKNVRIIINGKKLERFENFTNFDQIDFVADISQALTGIDLLILLDASEYQRFSLKPEEFKAALPANTICIDHHASPPDQFTLLCRVPTEPATAVLIYKLFESEITLDKPLAEALLLGLLSDTGNFAYLKPDQSEVFLIAKRLLEVAQVEIQAFQASYQLIPARVLELIGQFIANTKYHPGQNGWPDWQSSFLPLSVALDGHFSAEEITAAKDIYASHYLRTVKGYGWGVALATQLDGRCKLSARSLPGSANVRKIMERTGLGGGHDRAAGGTFKPEAGKPRDPEECLKWFEKWLDSNQVI